MSRRILSIGNRVLLFALAPPLQYNPFHLFVQTLSFHRFDLGKILDSSDFTEVRSILHLKPRVLLDLAKTTSYTCNIDRALQRKRVAVYLLAILSVLLLASCRYYGQDPKGDETDKKPPDEQNLHIAGMTIEEAKEILPGPPGKIGITRGNGLLFLWWMGTRSDTLVHYIVYENCSNDKWKEIGKRKVQGRNDKKYEFKLKHYSDECEYTVSAVSIYGKEGPKSTEIGARTEEKETEGNEKH